MNQRKLAIVLAVCLLGVGFGAKTVRAASYDGCPWYSTVTDHFTYGTVNSTEEVLIYYESDATYSCFAMQEVVVTTPDVFTGSSNVDGFQEIYYPPSSQWDYIGSFGDPNLKATQTETSYAVLLDDGFSHNQCYAVSTELSYLMDVNGHKHTLPVIDETAPLGTGCPPYTG